MKRLLLLRHAKSRQDGFAARDFDRQLNAKGRRAARAIGHYLRDRAIRFDAVIASPAARVTETLDEVAAGYGEPLAPQWERRVYLASAGELLELVRETPETAATILLVGHNPGLEQLIFTLVPTGTERAPVEEKYPTATLAEISLDDAASWRDIAPGGGRLSRFVRPRDLDPTLGPDPA